MLELLEAAIAPINIVFTVLLSVVLLYWLSVIIGALHVDSFDFDFDTDIDMDADLDVDMDTELDGGAYEIGWFAGALHFFNFGRLPFMIILTFLILSMWSISILANYYWGGGSIWFALAMFFPNLFVSLIVTKLITTPLVPIFKNLDKGVEPVNYIGLTCKLLLPATTSQMGQAEVLVEDSPLLINVKVSDRQPQPILRGEEAMIVSKGSSEKFFLIEKI